MSLWQQPSTPILTLAIPVEQAVAVCAEIQKGPGANLTSQA